MSTKALKEAVILTGTLYAWCTMGGRVGGYCIGAFVTPAHPIPMHSFPSYKSINNANLNANVKVGRSNLDN